MFEYAVFVRSILGFSLLQRNHGSDLLCCGRGDNVFVIP
ncbi:unnamed protein product [Cylicostephanus goldi]|uniref:Uncharacterized protein n=1 Tax=Cylicostephanus goldi TaxID=71465 RepID=A0A3P7QIT2_CYLGO|nr:unnamed protein product [Cylicostephanus goldi]